MPKAVKDVKAILAQFEDEAETVEASGGGAQGIPPGNYQAVVRAPKSGDVVSVDSDDATRARVVFEVVEANDDALVGRRDSKSFNIIGPDGNLDERGLGYLKGFIQTCGAEFDSLENLPETLVALCGTVVEIAVVESDSTDAQGNPYINIYVNDLVATSDEEVAEY